MNPSKWFSQFMRQLVQPYRKSLLNTARLVLGEPSTNNKFLTNNVSNDNNNNNQKDNNNIFSTQANAHNSSTTTSTVKQRRNSRNNGHDKLREAQHRNDELEKSKRLHQLNLQRKQNDAQQRKLRRQEQIANFSNSQDFDRKRNHHNNQSLSSSPSPSSSSNSFKRCYYVPVMNPLPDLKDKQLTVLDTHLYGIRDIDFLKGDYQNQGGNSNTLSKLPQSVIDTADIRNLEMYRMNDMLNSFLFDSHHYLEEQKVAKEINSGEVSLNIEEIDDDSEKQTRTIMNEK